MSNQLMKARSANLIKMSRTSPAADAIREAHELELAEFYFRGSHDVSTDTIGRLLTLKVNLSNEKLTDESFREFTKSFIEVLEEELRTNLSK